MCQKEDGWRVLLCAIVCANDFSLKLNCISLYHRQTLQVDRLPATLAVPTLIHAEVVVAAEAEEAAEVGEAAIVVREAMDVEDHTFGRAAEGSGLWIFRVERGSIGGVLHIL